MALLKPNLDKLKKQRQLSAASEHTLHQFAARLNGAHSPPAKIHQPPQLESPCPPVDSQSRQRNGSDNKIIQLTNELYPQLAQIQTPQELMPKITRDWTRSEEKLWHMDPFTSHRAQENKVLMKQAQRQLDRRMLHKAKAKARKKNKGGIFISEDSYPEAYRRFKTQQPDLFSNYYESQADETSREGIHYYKQLKNKPALLQYTKDKIRQRSVQAAGKSLKHSQPSDFVLGVLQRRKNNSGKAQADVGAERAEQQHYHVEIHNMDLIQQRFKKIYSRLSEPKLTCQVEERLKDSPLVRNQIRILGDERLSPKNLANKSRLISKFNAILSSYGRSTSHASQKQLTNTRITIQKKRSLAEVKFE